MVNILTDAFSRQKILLQVEDCLLQRAWELYNRGFRPPTSGRPGINAAQMAAIDEKIQVATSIRNAHSEVSKFLDKQLEKLEAKKSRTGKVESWLIPVVPENKSLGEILKIYIGDQNYLPCDLNPSDSSRLDLMRRFWTYLYGLYRYECACKKRMTFINFNDC